MKVLIPVQDSVFGDAITDFIAGHKWEHGTEFKVLSVIEYTSYGEMLGEMYCCQATRAVYDERVAAATKLLEEYARKLDYAMPGSFVEHQIRYGEPKNIILDEAQAWGADTIVMGSHARKGMSRFLLGSVSMAVLAHSPCSVVIVKLPKSEQRESKAVASKEAHSDHSCKAGAGQTGPKTCTA